MLRLFIKTPNKLHTAYIWYEPINGKMLYYDVAKHTAPYSYTTIHKKYFKIVAIYDYFDNEIWSKLVKYVYR